MTDEEKKKIWEEIRHEYKIILIHQAKVKELLNKLLDNKENKGENNVDKT